MRGARPISSSAVRSQRPRPAPPRRRRTRRRPPITQIGRSVTARISSIFAGHSWICQRFQSSGKPCTRDHVEMLEHALAAPGCAMKPGSIGDMPPSTRGRRRVHRPDRTAGEDRAISAKQRPVGVELRVPMRLVVGLVPDHRRFDHARRPSAPGRRRRAGGCRDAPADIDLLLRVARRSRSRRCAAWPRRRRGSAPTSWSGRARSDAR